MLSFIPGPVKGALAIIYLILNTLLWTIPLFAVSFFKIIPVPVIRKGINAVLNRIANNWIFCNNMALLLLKKIKWDITGVDKLKKDEWYLVISNHQTWVDILVLQKIFYNRVPFLKFFLKKELIWVPILGQAWWALDYPFMKRYSSEFLQKYPHLKGKDIEITKKACEKFKLIPVSVMNFVEGTRFTEEKQKQQGSPYKHLLKPKSGGIAFVLSAMGDELHRLLDVTIAYPNKSESFWHFLCSKYSEIKVHVNVSEIDEKMMGDYFNDEKFRNQFQDWLNKLWSEKDKRMAKMLSAKP